VRSLERVNELNQLVRTCSRGLQPAFGSRTMSELSAPERGLKPATTCRTQFVVGNHCSLAYSALAWIRMGILGSASSQSVRKSWYAALALVLSPVLTIGIDAELKGLICQNQR
jgi:hypothetical protein